MQWISRDFQVSPQHTIRCSMCTAFPEKDFVTLEHDTTPYRRASCLERSDGSSNLWVSPLFRSDGTKDLEVTLREWINTNEDAMETAFREIRQEVRSLFQEGIDRLQEALADAEWNLEQVRKD